jgi:hypothetical protein
VLGQRKIRCDIIVLLLIGIIAGCAPQVVSIDSRPGVTVAPQVEDIVFIDQLGTPCRESAPMNSKSFEFQKPLDTTRKAAIDTLLQMGFTIVKSHPLLVMGEKPVSHEWPGFPGLSPPEKFEGKTWHCVWLVPIEETRTKVFAERQSFVQGPTSGLFKSQPRMEPGLIEEMVEVLCGGRLLDFRTPGQLLYFHRDGTVCAKR